MISKKDYKKITKEIIRLLKFCENLIAKINDEKCYYYEEIQSGDYSDDDIEAIIKGTLNDYEVEMVSICLQMLIFENWIERLEKDKYCLLKWILKNKYLPLPILVNYRGMAKSFKKRYPFDEMEETIFLNLKEFYLHEIILFMAQILQHYTDVNFKINIMDVNIIKDIYYGRNLY
jgi:hypothetical protein